MRPLYVTSDWHLGVIRSAGTTPATAYQLRQDLLTQFQAMLDIVDSDLLIAGDLFDTASIPMTDLLQTYSSLASWLSRGIGKLYCQDGNHDLSKNSVNLSSFQFLAKLLQEQFGAQVVHVEGGQLIREGIYAVGHVANQDLMNLELGKIPECQYAVFHANYNNHFAQQGDHSLDVSEEQILNLPIQTAIFAHEHIQRTELKGKVIVIGNPQPSSISDCLGNTTKRMLKITDAGMEFIETWKAEGDFAQIDWRDLEDTGARFIRVTGTASSAEAAQVVTAIAKFRNQSSALVISNAVTVEGQDSTEEINLTHEQINNFNVMEALLEILTPDEGAKITKLMENRKIC